MLDDIRMWLYLRLLDSELRGLLPAIKDSEDGKYGSVQDVNDKQKRFRRRENFMSRAQTQNGLFFAALPSPLHKFWFRDMPRKANVHVTEKTKRIFASADELKYLQYPLKKYSIVATINAMYEKTEEVEKFDTTEIAISGHEGNRFISYSGLVGHLYNHHWQFVLLLAAFVTYVAGKAFGLWAYFCETYPNWPAC